MVLLWVFLELSEVLLFVPLESVVVEQVAEDHLDPDQPMERVQIVSVQHALKVEELALKVEGLLVLELLALVQVKVAFQLCLLEPQQAGWVSIRGLACKSPLCSEALLGSGLSMP